MNYMIQESGVKSLENLLNERNNSRVNTMEDKDPFQKGLSNSPDQTRRLEKLARTSMIFLFCSNNEY